MSKYRDFIKSWQTDNKISSFFGSDKRAFLDDWQRFKSTNIGKKTESPNVAIEPMEIAEPTVSEKVSPKITIAPRKEERVNAIKIKLTPNTDKTELRSFVKKLAEKNGDSVPSYTAKLITNMIGSNMELFGDWVALDDDKETVKNALGEATDIEYNKYETIGEDEGSTITPDLLKIIKSAEKKGLISVEYKLIKEIADISQAGIIKRPKQ